MCQYNAVFPKTMLNTKIGLFKKKKMHEENQLYTLTPGTEPLFQRCFKAFLSHYLLSRYSWFL